MNDDLGMIGNSGALCDARDALRRAALGSGSVLLRGESGTGKELAARAIHALSRRASEPLLGVNCAAIPESLLESELFGHVKGAFTDASSEHAGLFLRAGQGTLFLDEIGDMPLSMQARILRALQDRRIRPVGGEREVPFHARVVAATHRDLEADIEAGRFRADLFFRINVFEITLPPLRARGADVLSLAEAAVQRCCVELGRSAIAISPEAQRYLVMYAWPGNVRELENCMQRAVAYAKDALIRPEDLPARVRGGSLEDDGTQPIPPEGAASEQLVTLAEMEKRYIARVLREVGGNQRRAARVLGIDRSTLHRKLVRYQVAH